MVRYRSYAWPSPCVWIESSKSQSAKAASLLLPAQRHAFTDSPLPSVIVADSSFIFEALIDSGQGQYAATIDFADRLRRANVRLLYSGLLFIEAPQCWRRLYNKGVLIPSQKSTDPITNRLTAYVEADQDLKKFLAGFNTMMIRMTPQIIQAALRLTAIFNLKSHDALVAAIAQDTRISDIAATDKDFRKIDNIELWDGLFP
jgi:predicted nucleic acid-binding protein